MNIGQLLSALIVAILGFSAWYLQRFYQTESKLVYWIPHASSFQVPLPNGGTNPIFVGSLFVQNIGQKKCDKIEVAMNMKLDLFEISPYRTYSPKWDDAGHYIINFTDIA